MKKEKREEEQVAHLLGVGPLILQSIKSLNIPYQFERQNNFPEQGVSCIFSVVILNDPN